MIPLLSAKPLLVGIAAIGALLFVVGAYAVGRHDGGNAVALKASEGARAVERALNEKAAELNSELTKLRADNRVLKGTLDDEAKTDPNSANPALGADSLQRIQRAFDAARGDTKRSN